MRRLGSMRRLGRLGRMMPGGRCIGWMRCSLPTIGDLRPHLGRAGKLVLPGSLPLRASIDSLRGDLSFLLGGNRRCRIARVHGSHLGGDLGGVMIIGDECLGIVVDEVVRDGKLAPLYRFRIRRIG